jgi:hypothetical protein
MSFPDETPEMYHWRGDYGLLDRLSYGESREIPRSWKMTSLDQATIQARIQSGPPAFSSQSTEFLPLADRPFEEKDEEVSGSTQFDSQSGPSTKSSVEGSSTPFSDAPKAKRYQLSLKVANCNRRRIDKKKILHGNNKFGRRGNSRCLRCRVRKIKVKPY